MAKLVEACIRSDVVHAFTLFAQRAPDHDDETPEVFAVVEAIVDEADAFRARYGDLTPISLRRHTDRYPVLCPRRQPRSPRATA